MKKVKKKKYKSYELSNKIIKLKILNNKEKYDKFMNENSLFFIENEIYVPKEEMKKKIEFDDNFIIFKKNITNKTDLICNYTEIPNNLDSNIQIACNYLFLLKNNKLNDINIFVFDHLKGKGINLEVLKNTKVTPEYMNYLKKDYYDYGNSEIYKKILLETTLIKSIPENECRNLLLEYFIQESNLLENINKENINEKEYLNYQNEELSLDSFYQINSFINLFCSQLKIFSNQKTYYTNNIKNMIKLNVFPKEILIQFRPFIIESLKNNSNICGKSAFHSILKKQNEAIELLNKEKKKLKEEKKDNKEIKEEKIIENKKENDILAEEVISFNEILKDNDLIILNENEDGLTIISRLANQKYKNELELKEKKMEKKSEKMTISERYNLLNILNTINPNSLEESKNENRIIPIKNYEELTQEEYIREIIKMVSNNLENEDDEQPRYIDELNEDYVFTHDNFIKMIMINLRMNANIPLVIMGETGCGKTSLIKALANLKKAEMIIFNIHAGIDNNKIINFVKENNLLEDEENIFKKNYKKIKNIWVFLDEVNTSNSLGLFSEMMIKKTILGKSIKKNVSFIAACNPYKKTDDNNKFHPGLNPNKYLDCNNIKKLAYSVNPLPYSLLNFVFYFGHLKDENEKKYIENMLEKSLNNLINHDKNIKVLNVEQLKIKVNKLKEIISKPIINAQNFVREKKGVSSVSLRDVNRFVRFFEWFYKMKMENFLEIKINNLIDEFLIKEKEKNINYNNEEKKIEIKKIINEIDEYIFASILGIYICYFLRLETNELREKLNEKISEDFKIINFEIFCRHIVRNLINEIKIEKGIAKNRALLENLFALFICINNKIPLFLCGKPGYSKSLSLSIIEKAMRGKKSLSEKFKKLPEISRLTYQGSLTSTSEGVLNVFNNGRTKLKNNKIRMEIDYNKLKQKIIKLKKEFKKLPYEKNNRNIEKQQDINSIKQQIENLPKIKDYIYMIYFDEMGLAEISPNNPLKVIHSQLEYEKEDEKLSFVGISNWTLDASKMNRGIYLSVSEPDEKDWIETAIEIANSYNENLGFKYEDIFKLLALSYYQFIHYNPLSDNIDFHGARDFYHLIKLTARNLVMKDNNEIDLNDYDIVRNSVQRNFGGYEGSIENFEKIIQNKQPYYNISNYINITKCIKDNINDKYSRYLMVISDTSKSQFLIKFFLNSINKENTFLLGSQFEKDLKSEEYTASLLQKIQVSMRNGNIIVMNNLEPIYPSLYDLFNQTFIKICERKYARITIGSSTDSLFEVDDNFRCIILVDNKKIIKQDKPFLNRFEKQIFSFKDLLTEEENNFAEEIYDILKTVVDPINRLKSYSIDLNNHLINFNLDEIRGIIYDNKGKNNEEIKKIIFQKISKIFSQDIMININYSSFNKKYNKEFKQIIEYYNTKPNNFNEFIESLNINNNNNDEIKKHKNIIFTFSKIFEGIEHEEISLRIIDNSDHEKLILDFIEQFFRSEKKKIMVIQIKQDYYYHLNHIQNLIDNYINENNINLLDHIKPKFITFIIHLNRELSKNKNREIDNIIISHLSPYNQIFIDNLKGENISITQFYDLDNKILFNNLEKKGELQSIKFFNKNSEFKSIIYQGFMRFSYKFLNDPPNNIIIINENGKEEIINKLTMKNYQELSTKILKLKETEFCDLIQEKIIDVICTKEIKNVVFDIITEIKYRKKGIDFVSDIKEYMRDLLLKYLIKFIYKSENDGMLTSILFKPNKSEKLKDYLKYYIKNLIFEKEDISIDIRGNTVNIIFGLDIPLIYPNLFNIKILAFTFSKKFKEIENKMRVKRIYDEDVEDIIFNFQKYFNENNIFNNVKSCNEIDKEDIEIFYDNYRNIFILDNMKETKKYNEILKFILETKFNDDKKLENYENIGEVILWIETYKYFIIEVLKIINELLGNNLEELNKISEIINLRKKNEDNDLNIINIIKIEEPFYSIFEFLSYYMIEKREVFEEKIQFIEYSCDLFIQCIEELYIPSRSVFLLKIFIEVYKLFINNKPQFEKYINEVNEEIKNIRNNNIENMKNNWKIELEILKEHYNKIDFIISLFISKYRQTDNIEYRIFLIQMIIENDILLPNSQRFFSRVFYNRTSQINLDFMKEEREKEFIIFNENLNDEEIMNFLNDCVLYKNEESIKYELDNNNKFVITNEKRKVLIQILLYVFQTKININENDLDEYVQIMKYISESIFDNNSEKNKKEINYIIYPNLTRIFMCSFLQIFIYKLFKEISKNSQSIKPTTKKFFLSFEGFKKVWKYVQILMLKILYFNILNKDMNKLEKELEEGNFSEFFPKIECQNIETIINSFEVHKEEENYYPVIFMPIFVKIEDIENEFLFEKKENSLKNNINGIINNSINYPILSVFINNYAKIKEGKSFQNKVKNIIIMNDFENSLLNYFNFIQRLNRNSANKILLEQEIEFLKDKICIEDNYEKFKKIWNSEFSNFEYEINNEKIKMKKIDSSTLIEDILMDNKQEEGGRQITEMYKKLIKSQNDLIEEFIKSLKKNIEMLKSLNLKNNDFDIQFKIKEINYLIQELNIEHSINIQNITEKEIINLEKINIETFQNFESLIYGFSKRKCLTNNLTLNYNEYDKFEINYELIEKYIRKCLLNGKRYFNYDLKYINYKSEFSDDNFTSNLNELISTFGYEPLSKEKREKIENNELPSIISSLDQLIFYINHNSFKANDSLLEVSNSAKTVANLTKEFDKLINENNFFIKDLPGLYDYIEEKIFPQTKENAKNQIYMFDLGEGVLSDIIKNKIDKVLFDNAYIHKDTLLRVLRKFTIKNLLSDESSVNSDDNLFECLQKDQGLWFYKKKNNINDIKQRSLDFENINQLFVNQSAILVKHTVLFYEKLNGEDISKKYQQRKEDEFKLLI